MDNTIIASLAGAWVLEQKNGGPAELGMMISNEGMISLTYNKKALTGYQGAAYAGESNPDGQYPVIMSIYSTSSSDGMGLSITNYTGVLIPQSASVVVDTLEGTAIGIQDKASASSSVAIFGWSACRALITEES
jgi:hypothetical protein